jgi:hypothetical protein
MKNPTNSLLDEQTVNSFLDASNDINALKNNAVQFLVVVKDIEKQH